MKTFAERFWERVEVRGAGECWPWKNSTKRYGYFMDQRAHRTAFFLRHGRWPTVGRHTCDNTLCCNPSHVEDGTQADNMSDMVSRGRQSKGEARPGSKLTKRKAALIKSLKGCAPEIAVARLFGVARTTVRAIQHDIKWRASK